MGSLYFIAKNTIFSLILVCLLQIKVFNKSLENYLMDFVRQSLATKFLNVDSTTYKKSNEIRITQKDLKEIRKKIFESPFLVEVKDQAKELFYDELKKNFESKDEDKKDRDQ